MYKGKRMNPKSSADLKRKLALLASLALILTVGIDATLAWLTDNTNEVENVFTPGRVPNEIIEEFNGEVKECVQIRNTGNVSAYVRVAVVATWAEVQVDENGAPILKDGKYVPTGNVAATVPIKGTDFDWVDGSSKWVYNEDDGYYYYTESVAAGGITENLFTDCKLKDNVTPTEGYRLSIEILSQTVQSEGTDSNGTPPVELAWGVDAARIVGVISE